MVTLGASEKNAPIQIVSLSKTKDARSYEARPKQCRTWPFWPEMMDAKTWSKEITSFCPGVGKGKLVSGAEIEKSLREQLKQKF